MDPVPEGSKAYIHIQRLIEVISALHCLACLKTLAVVWALDINNFNQHHVTENPSKPAILYLAKSNL